jgi:type II secretory ATPase GspE/PulE/Tfp pilus assembly ATPase PilB-like protein
VNLVYDFSNGHFVVSPAFLIGWNRDPNLLSEHLARNHQVVGMERRGDRLMLLCLNPLNRDSLLDVEVISECELVLMRLDLHGGRLPTWDELDRQPPRPQEASPWTQRNLPEAVSAIRQLHDQVYGYLEGPFKPNYGRCEEESMAKAMGKQLSEWIKNQYEQVWVLPRPPQVALLARKANTWQELAKPSITLLPLLLGYLKQAANLDCERRSPQRGQFEAHQRLFLVETHLGEHGEEAMITVGPSTE